MGHHPSGRQALFAEQLPEVVHPCRFTIPSAGQHDLLGLFCAGSLGAEHHRSAEAWHKLWAARLFLTTRALGTKVRLHRLRASILSALTRVALACHLRKDTLRTASSTMHEFRPATDGWHEEPESISPPCGVVVPL